MKPKRTVYIAQFSDNNFMASFLAIPEEYPFETIQKNHPRRYAPITPASLDRLNRLVYLAPSTVKISAHLSPYICLWVTFPAKEK